MGDLLIRRLAELHAGSRRPGRSAAGTGGIRGPLTKGVLAAVLLVLGLLRAAPASAQAPVYDLSVRDVPVATALEELVSLTGMSLVYSSDVVRGRRAVCRREGASAEALLRCILEGPGLDFYRLSSGTYVVIAAPEEAPEYGVLAGEVLDGITGEPVPWATLEVEDGSRRTLANAAGMFILPRLLPGRHDLRVSGMGYAPARLPIEITAAGTVRQRIRLDPTVMELDPLVVEGMEVGGGLGGHRLRDAGPGEPVARDLSRRLRTGMGISRRPLFADLSIQGSAPGEHVVRLDGVSVFDPVSLGRSRSAFSPLALRRITLRRAGFGVEHGSWTGGVIDLEHAVMDRQGRSGLTVLADPFSVNGDLSLPLAGFGGEGTFMVAGRTSVWGTFREPSLDEALREWNRIDPVLMRSVVGDGLRFTDALTFEPHRHGSDLGFSDAHAALQFRFPGFRTLNASFYRGSNRVGTELFAAGSDDATGTLDRLFLTRDGYSWSNTMGQARMDFLLGDRASFRIRGWGSRHELAHDFDLVDGGEVGYDAEASPGDPGYVSVAEAETALRDLLARRPGLDDGNRIQELGMEASGDLAAGAGHFLSGGVEAVRISSKTHFLDGFVRPIQTRITGWRWSGFVQDRWQVGRRVTLEGGLRYTQVGRGSGYLEPRLALRFDGVSGGLGPWSLQGSGGVYRQFLNQFELANLGPSALVPEVRFWLPADGTLEPPRTRHLAVEAVARPARGWELRVEVYHKWLDRTLALDYGRLLASGPGSVMEVAQADFIGVSEGVAYGAGLRGEWQEGRTLLRLSYDWSVSERTFPSRFDGVRQPTPWNEPHAVKTQGRLPLRAGVALEAETSHSWGRSWGLRQAYYDFLTVEDLEDGPPIGLPGDLILPSRHSLDLGLSWLGRVRGSVAEFRGEVRNALGGHQVLDYSLRRTSAPDGGTTYTLLERVHPGPALFLSLRLGL